MKKVLGIVLVAALAATVVGCGKCAKKDAAPAVGATCGAACTCPNKAACAEGKCPAGWTCPKCEAAKAVPAAAKAVETAVPAAK